MRDKNGSLWSSHAEWPEGVYCSATFGDNTTTDRHHSKQAAQWVCNELERNGFGGDNKNYPIRTWIEERK